MSENDLVESEQIEIPDTLAMLPVRDVVVFPFMILPLFVGRESSIQAVDDALSKDRLIFLAAQKFASQEEPEEDEIHRHGTVAIIMKMRKLPDGRVKILVQGLLRAHVKKFVQSKPFFQVAIERFGEKPAPGTEMEAEALIRNVRENLEKVISLGKILSPDLLTILDDVHDPGRLADLVASNLGLKVDDSQEILQTINPIERLRKVNEHLLREHELLSMQARIQTQAKEEMNRMQKEYFLREQLRAIRNELGDADGKNDELDELKKKIADANMPEEVAREAAKQLSRLESMHPDAAEATMVRTYLDWLVEVPWSTATADQIDLKKAKKILDEDHFDLEKVKERILEFLGVRKLKKRMKGPILCFIGPPGVGKTSLGKSIARSLGRKFVRIALGGVRDEAEIRGHRRTYVGAMPGRIIQGLKQAGTNNPVFMIDELDKLGADFRGDPSSALLEVLDPEQNDSFRDHYLNLPFDLSNVMFIATANQADPIPPPLRDRMEILYLSGYTEEEKVKIAHQYLIPKQLEENGITGDHLFFSDRALKAIVSGYTREAGLRNFEREIAAVCRKVARRVAERSPSPEVEAEVVSDKRRKSAPQGASPQAEGRAAGGRPQRATKSAKSTKAAAAPVPRTVVTSKSLPRYLGPPKFQDEDAIESDEIGVATGLAWTQFGGEVLHVETTTMRGKGSLTLTGQLGDVMKESAQAALSYARTKAKELKLAADFFNELEVHVHVPSGAIPKDGPSAGVTMCTSLVSAIAGIPVRRDLAMTGEITLRGRVLPIGGLKEKILAARRAGVSHVVFPAANQKDLDEVPAYIRRKMTFHPVRHVDEVLELALVGGLRTRATEPDRLLRGPKSTGKAPSVSVSPVRR